MKYNDPGYPDHLHAFMPTKRTIESLMGFTFGIHFVGNPIEFNDSLRAAAWGGGILGTRNSKSSILLPFTTTEFISNTVQPDRINTAAISFAKVSGSLSGVWTHCISIGPLG